MKKIFPAPVIYNCGHLVLATYGEPQPWAPDGTIEYLDCIICRNAELENKVKELQGLQTGLQIVLNKDSETPNLDLLSEVAALFDADRAEILKEKNNLLIKIKNLEDNMNNLRNNILEEVAQKMDSLARIGSAKLVRKMMKNTDK